LTIQPGTTFNVAANVPLQIQPGVTITDSGAFNIAPSAVLSIVDGNSNLTSGVVVNGTMNASSVSFLRSGGNGSDTTRIQVNFGGQFTASGDQVKSTFAWDNLTFNSGSTDSLQNINFSGQLAVNSGATLTISQNDLSNVGANGVVATGAPAASIDMTN